MPLAASGREVEVTCWKDRCAAFDAGEEAAEFLTRYLGSPVRLVRFDARRKRPSNPQWTPGVEALNQFSDGFPWLLISEASLEDLNTRLARKLPMNRFRPNIVVSGLPPFGEDQLHELTAGGSAAAARQGVHALHRHDDGPDRRARATATSRCARWRSSASIAN